MLLAVLVLHVVDTLHAAQGSYGLLFTLYAGGGLAASAAVPSAHATWGTRRCLIISASLGALSLLVVAWGTTVAYAAIGMTTLGAATMLYNVVAVTVRQQRTPDHLLGRVSSAFNVLSVGSLPLAALAAGALATMFGTSISLTVAAALCALATTSISLLVPLRAAPDTTSSDSGGR
jgi:MFS family permease